VDRRRGAHRTVEKISRQLYSRAQKELDLSQTISCAPSDTLCLSLDWSNRRSPTKYASHQCLLARNIDFLFFAVLSYMSSLVVSLSDGNLCLLQPKDRAGLLITDTWVAHDYEPWVAAWNYWDMNIIYSGQSIKSSF
jgi:diphthamide biosynthesis protein 7